MDADIRRIEEILREKVVPSIGGAVLADEVSGKVTCVPAKGGKYVKITVAKTRCGWYSVVFIEKNGDYSANIPKLDDLAPLLGLHIN